jgi:voltage-gated sodium channel
MNATGPTARFDRLLADFKRDDSPQECREALYSLCYRLSRADRWVAKRERVALDAVTAITGDIEPLELSRAVDIIGKRATVEMQRHAYEFLNLISNADSLLQSGEERLLATCRKAWGIRLTWRGTLETLVHSDPARYCIILVILANAVFIGLDNVRHEPLWGKLQFACLILFAAEFALKCIAVGPRKFFLTPWNLFDLAVTAPGFIPVATGSVTVLRLLRIVRILQVLKFIGKYPDFRLTIEVLFRACKSMVPLAILLAIFTYIYAILGMTLFGANDPHFATFREAVYTLFSSLTYQSWGDLRETHMHTHGFWVPTLYYASWILIGAMLLLNLVIGIIVNQYGEVKKEQAMEDHTQKRIGELLDELNFLIRQQAAQKERREPPPPGV